MVSSNTCKINVILHNIRSLYNVGSFFRTCDGVDIEKLYLTGYTGYPPRKEITKTALGAENHVSWEQHRELAPLLCSLKQQGVMIVAVERTATSQHYLAVPYRFPVAVIFGNEVTGVENEWLAQVDAIAHVPMLGYKESLNVAVCGGVVLYGLRQLWAQMQMNERGVLEKGQTCDR